MAPPQVSLSKKDLKEIDLSDQLAAKEDEDLSVVTVETERRVRALRNQRKKAKSRRIICGVAIVILVSVAALSTMCLIRRLRKDHDHHKRRHWHCKYGKKQLHENVRVDAENQLIYAKHDRDVESNTKAIHILHEYQRGLIVYKDKDQNTCYIDRLEETFEEGYKRWEGYEKNSREENRPLRVLDDQEIKVEVLEHVCDVHILEHCRNAHSYWVMEIEEKEVTQEMKIVHV